MNFKKSQITIFVLLGIVLILAFGFLMFVGNPKTENEIIEDTTSPIELYTNLCIEKTLEKGLFLKGVSDTNELSNYLKNNIGTCISNFDKFPGTEVIEGEFNSDILLSADNKILNLKVNYPLTIKKQESTHHLSDFYTTYGLSLSENLFSINGITQRESTLRSHNGFAVLRIPANTAASLSGNPLTSVSLTIGDNTRLGVNTLGEISYVLGPPGAEFDPPIEFTIEYDESTLSPSIDEEDLAISYYDGTNWVEWPSVVDTSFNKVTAYLSHFTPHAISYLSQDSLNVFTPNKWVSIGLNTNHYGEGPKSCGTSSNNYIDGWDHPLNICYKDSSPATHQAGYTNYYIGGIPNVSLTNQLSRIVYVGLEVGFTPTSGSSIAGLFIDNKSLTKPMRLDIPSPATVDLTDLRNNWNMEDLADSIMIFYTSVDDVELDYLKLKVYDQNQRVYIQEGNLIIELPQYCEIQNYRVILQEGSTLLINQTSSSNTFTIPISHFSCNNGFKLTGSYTKNNISTEILSRDITCSYNITPNYLYESDESRDCLNKGVCNVNFSQRCQNNIWVGCNYPGEYSQNEACDGLDNNCDGKLSANEYTYSTGTEVCNQKDDDCDGQVDEGLQCIDCSLSSIGTDFLYKPDTRVIFFPKNLIDKITNAKACRDINCNNLVQNLALRERVWLGSPLYHATFSQNNPVYIVITISDGRKVYWHLPNPKLRYYMPHWKARGGVSVGNPRIVGCN